MNKPYAYYEHKKLNNFKELLILNLENKKDEVAFIFNNAKKEEIKKKYNDFYNDVTLMSNYLSNNYKNKHIALIGENSYNYLVLFFSIIISKNVAVLIDKDLSYVYNLKRSQARTLKENFAVSNTRYSDVNDTIELTNKNGDDITLNQLEVSEVVEARLVDLLRLAKKQINILIKHI